MHSFIHRHNNTILTKHTNQNRASKHSHMPRNCHQADECPKSGNCLAKSVVYRAEVISDNGETKAYIVVTSNELKSQYRNHLKSFRHQKYSNDTELSKYVWELKTENRRFNITWSIIKKVSAYKVGSRRCNLCLEEKLQLMKGEKRNILNKRSELFFMCRHVTKHDKPMTYL